DVVGEDDLVLNDETYTNAHGDEFTISMFKYYVSNVSLVKADGSKYTIPESYFLIDAADEDSHLQTLENIPAGDYTAISFTIGVDSVRNSSGAQTGALDPAKGMFWDWDTGYIFVKFEGNSPKSTAPGNKLTFHIGGAKPPNNTIRTTTQSFNGDVLRVRSNSKPQIHLAANAAALFTGTTDIDFATLSVTISGANSVIVANNYVNSFLTVEHLHN
ncbi:MAG: MbnP family protein, partial [Mucilaginibacter sp.]